MLQHIKGLRILVADDDPLFSTVATTALARAGAEVNWAGDGAAALELLSAEAFDAALIDLSMPRIDGFRLISMVRATPRLSRLALIVVTVRQDEGAVREAMSLGADAFETKPIVWSRMPDRISAAVALRDGGVRRAS